MAGGDNEQKMIHAELTQVMKELKDVVDTNNRTQTVWYGFWRGIVAAMGGVIGATVGISLILWLLERLAFLPIVGDFIARIVSLLQHKIP